MIRLYVFLLVFASGVFVSLSGEAFAKNPKPPTGCLKPSPAALAWAEQYKAPPDVYSKARLAQLPSAVKNIEYLPAVRTQQLANCGAYAPTYYYKTWQESKEHGWGRSSVESNPAHIMSPGFTFPLSNDALNDGAAPEVVLATFCARGCATWDVYPENPADWYTLPPDDVWLPAMRYRALSWSEINTSTNDGLLLLKAHLASGDLAVFVTPVYHDLHAAFWRADGFPFGTLGPGLDYHSGVIFGDGNEFWDLHAMTLIGYDDTRSYYDGVELRQGAFLAVNSWGGDWGVRVEEAGSGGFCWIGYDYFRDRIHQALTMTDRIGYAPTDFAALALSHGARGELTRAELFAGAMSHTAPRVSLFPAWGVGLVPYEGTVLTDISDLNHTNVWSYNLVLEDIYLNTDLPIVPEIRSLEIRRADGVVLPAFSLPIRLEDETEAIVTASLFDHWATNLPPLSGASADWGDLDGDGIEELILTGMDEQGAAITNLYAIAGDALETMPANLPPLRYAAAAMEDVNNDGRRDLLLIGEQGLETVARLYITDSTGQLGERPTNLSGASIPQMAWGDYDNDGDADLVLSGFGMPPRLWRNDHLRFTDTGVEFPSDTSVPPAAWGDMNNDGRLDLVVGTHVYINKGGGVFLPEIPIAEESAVALAWGDANGDGWLDLAVCHLVDFMQDLYATRILINQQGGGFIPLAVNLPGAHLGSLSWGDFDNDGRLDLALCGSSNGSFQTFATSVWRQQNDGSFRDAGFSLPPIQTGRLRWVDPDRDGDLDLIAVAGIPMNSQAPPQTVLRRNRLNDSNARSNTPPLPPSGLTAVPVGSHGIELKWNPSSDAETPANLLGYDLRIGTQPGRSDVVMPLGRLVGDARLSRRLAEGVPGAWLDELATGIYYWSVRSVDAVGGASSWAAEQTFEIVGDGEMIGDANTDGNVDIADLIRMQGMIAGQTPPDRWRADFNGNGVVEPADRLGLRNILLGFPPPGAVLTTLIGPEGGEIESEGLRILIPAGAWPSPVTLRVEQQEGVALLPPEEVPLAYRIVGLPGLRHQSIAVRLAATRRVFPPDTQPFAGIVWNNDAWGKPAYVTHSLETVRDVGGGWYEFEIPATDNPSPRYRLAADGEGRMGEWYLYPARTRRSGRFEVAWSPAVNVDSHLDEQIDILLADLNRIYEFYRAEPYSFSYAARTSWPFRVNVWWNLGTPGGDPNLGEFVRHSWFINCSYMDLNGSLLTSENRDLRNATLGHEWMHFIQQLWDGRRSVAVDRQWIYEAMAVHMEQFFVEKPDDYTPEIAGSYADLVGIGLPNVLGGDALGRRRYGYSQAPLLKFISQSYGDSYVRRMMNIMDDGKDQVSAVFDPAGTTALFVRIEEFWRNLLEGKVYGRYPYPNMVDSKHLVRPPRLFDSVGVHEELELGKMGYRHYLIARQNQTETYPPDHNLTVRFQGAQPATLLQVLRRDKGGEVHDYGTVADGEGAYLTIPNVSTLLTQSQFWLIASNRAFNIPHSAVEPVVIDCAATRSGPVTLESRDLRGTFPAMRYGLSVDGGEFSGWKTWSGKNSIGHEVHHARLSLWRLRPYLFEATVQAALLETTRRTDHPDGSYTILSTSPIKRFEAWKWKRGEMEELLIISGSAETGKLTLPIDRDESDIYFAIKAISDFTTTVHARDGSIREQWTEASKTRSLGTLFVDTR